MLEHLSRGLTFVVGSVVGGLALAFLIVAVRPDLIRGRAAPQPAASAAPATQVAAAAPPAATAATTPPARASYADAVQRAAPAVVNVYTDRVVTERLSPSLGELFGEYLPRYRQRIERTLGSGVIVDDKGHIVTNHHVIANADAIRVQLADGRIAEAHVVGSDPDTDLAVLSVGLKFLPVAPLGRSDQLRVGDVVLAIGNPLGLSHTVTHGIVSATSRAQLGIAPVEDFIQTDAPINRGNSGGALVDSSGALVGINTAMVAKSLGVEGIGFAIPVNLVRGVLADIIDHGRVIRGWIGISPEDITDEQAQQFGLAQGGVVIANLALGSPAQQAGLLPGDLLLAVDGASPRGAQDVLGRIARHKPGSTVSLRALRGHRTLDLEARAAERPRARQQPP
jgi:serine peptidase DegS